METKFKLSDKQVSTTFSGESVILNHSEGTYYTLNEVGSFIWDQLENSSKTIAELVQALKDEFEVSEEECTEDVKALLTDLQNEGLLEKI